MAETFFDNGLKFSCTQCHACCRHDPGYVFLSNSDVEQLVTGLRVPVRQFIDDFTRWVDLGEGPVLSLKEKKNYDCIFWDNGCQVYHHRPTQCRTYPFWETPLSSAEKWRWESRFCPGIGQGKLHTKEEITQALEKRRSNPVIRKDEWAKTTSS